MLFLQILIIWPFSQVSLTCFICENPNFNPTFLWTDGFYIVVPDSELKSWNKNWCLCVCMCYCLWKTLSRLICKRALFYWLEQKLVLTNQATLNTREIKLNKFQVYVNWEIFTIKLVPGINVKLGWSNRHVLSHSIKWNIKYNTFIVPEFNIS